MEKCGNQYGIRSGGCAEGVPSHFAFIGLRVDEKGLVSDP